MALFVGLESASLGQVRGLGQLHNNISRRGSGFLRSERAASLLSVTTSIEGSDDLEEVSKARAALGPIDPSGTTGL